MNIELQIFNANSGYSSARAILPDKTVRHIHSTVSPELENRYYDDITFYNNTIVFEGFGIGYHVLNKINEIPVSAKIIVIDFFEEFTLNAKQEIFKERSIEIINSQSTSENIHNVINNVKDPQIIQHPASYSVNSPFYDSINKKFFQKSITNTKKTAAKKIMLLYGTFFLEEEILNALKQYSEVEVCKFEYREISSAYKLQFSLQKALQKEKPDLVISVNCKGLDGEGYLSKICEKMGIPVALWFVDDPRPILLNHGKNINKNFIAFNWDRSYSNFLSTFNFDNIYYLPLACDPKLFNKNSRHSVNTEIGFVGSSMGDSFLNEIKKKFIYAPSLDSLILSSAKKLLTLPQSSPEDLIKTYCTENNFKIHFNDIRNTTWLTSLIIHTASMLQRKNIITSLKNFPLKIFGDPEGWNKLLGEMFPFYPSIDYRKHLCSTYQQIKININITSRQMPQAVNQRVFDIPMAGSFVINDNQKDLQELFIPDIETIIYSSIDELKDKINFYKSNENARYKISEKGRERILKEHTYLHRIKNILTSV